MLRASLQTKDNQPVELEMSLNISESHITLGAYVAVKYPSIARHYTGQVMRISDNTLQVQFMHMKKRSLWGIFRLSAK
jgi:hypothetical protein